MLPSPSRDSHFFRLFSRQQKIKQRQNGELLKEHTTCISEHTLPNAHTLWKKKGFFFFPVFYPFSQFFFFVFLTIPFLRFSLVSAPCLQNHLSTTPSPYSLRALICCLTPLLYARRHPTLLTRRPAATHHFCIHCTLSNSGREMYRPQLNPRQKTILFEAQLRT